MNVLHVKRVSVDGVSGATIGVVTLPEVYYYDDFTCFSLEDPPPERTKDGKRIKVAGQTRIPAGRYPLKWRKTGKWAKRFQARWKVKGSLEICNVPNYTDVLIHLGNTKKDTAGCLLVGMGADLQAGTIQKSRPACQQLYEIICESEGDWEIVIE